MSDTSATFVEHYGSAGQTFDTRTDAHVFDHKVGGPNRAARRAKPQPIGVESPRSNRSDAPPARTERAKRIRVRRRAERDARRATR